MSILQEVDLDGHLRRIKAVCPNAVWIAATDTEEVINSTDELHNLDVAAVLKISAERSRASIVMQGMQMIFSVPLTNHLETVIGWILVGFKPGEIVIAPMQIAEQIAQLSRELALTDELNLMAEELAERYEELNLIYSTSEKVDAEHDDEEVLTNVVENIVDFLNVPFALISVPEKNIWRWHCDGSVDHHRAESIWQGAEAEVYDWLTHNHQPLILNEKSDFEAFESLEQGAYRALVAPITNEADETIGSLTIMRRYEQGRISTSDKSLIVAMTQKVAQTIHYSYDAETGLPNQRKLDATLQRHRHALMGRDSHVLIQVVLKEADYIAQQWGQAMLVRIYQYIAEQVRHSARRADLCFRLNDGSICALYLNTSSEEIRLKSIKLAHTISLNTFMANHHEIRPRVSVGLTEVAQGPEKTDDYLFQINMANRIALEKNTNYVQIFDPEDQLVINQKSASMILATLHEALEHNHFQLFAQSIAPLASAETNPHFEVLLRLFDEDGQFISPAEFIPIGEKHHLMPEIDFWVINNTLQALATSNILHTHPDTVCSINLSGQSFAVPNLTTKIQAAISRAGVPPENLCFEVTETAAIADLSQAKQFIQRLREFGCKFALDDFGAGLSSFTYLRELALDYVKIDGSFVKDMLEDPVAATMVRSIHNMGAVMGLETVAEYVENQALAEELTRIGLDYGQGFGLDKPGPIDAYLQRWTQIQANHG